MRKRNKIKLMKAMPITLSGLSATGLAYTVIMEIKYILLN